MEFLDLQFWSFLWDGARYEAMIEAAGPWAPLIAIGAMIVVSFLPLPAETVAIANGMVFGRAEGFVLTWIGAMIAAMLAFVLARSVLRPRGYRSGLAPVRFGTFLWTSAIGMAPPIFAFVSIGALMTEQPWLGWMMLGAAIVFLLLLGWATRRMWGKNDSA